MKKIRIFIVLLLIIGSVSLCACENATQIRTATITEITSVGSKNYGVRITFANDSRLEGKNVDVQVKFNKIGNITFWEENNEKLNFEIEEIDEWYSITNLQAKANGREGTENFEKHNEALTRTYLWNYDGNIAINIRVVAGQKEANSEEKGYILVGSEPISDTFTLKIK